MEILLPVISVLVAGMLAIILVHLLLRDVPKLSEEMAQRYRLLLETVSEYYEIRHNYPVLSDKVVTAENKLFLVWESLKGGI